jgi:hypothetical protein
MVVTMQDEVLAEILEWSEGRPAWQRDALRRIFSAASLSPADFDELTDLCKGAHGLSPSRAARMLSEEHLAISGQALAPVRLVSVTHHRGVNALAPDQTVAMGEHLTVVYGENAAGKSGYARILKRACRSRSTEEILGNVLTESAPLKAQATIRFFDGSKETSHLWTVDAPLATQLGAVSVFDAHSAPIYLRDKTDVAFRPFGLDVFDRLSIACAEVRKRLEGEQRTLAGGAAPLPVLPEGTKSASIVGSLTALTKVDDLRALARLSQPEQLRLAELRERQRDILAANPRQRASDLSLKADRIARLRQQIAALGETLGEKGLGVLREAGEALKVSRSALERLRRTALTDDLLPGTGQEAWRSMWDAALAFSRATPGDAGIMTDGRCPLCQQAIGTDALERLSHFAEYAASSAQAEVRKTESTYQEHVARVTQSVTSRADFEIPLAELSSDNADLAARVQAVLEDAERAKRDVVAAETQGIIPSVRGMVDNVGADLTAFEAALRDRAKQLRTAAPTLAANDTAELRELEGRELLGRHLDVVEAEIERKKQLAAYTLCVDDTATQMITRKSTELTKRLVTDHLRGRFQEELASLEFTHLSIEIRAAGGTKGSLFHQLAFSSAPSVQVTNVLSEGESRTLSLAAFLTELSTAASKSAIIFDDPVSSLDHIWRERIARRLAAEAVTRQVIVFTHDLLFLRLLMSEADRRGIECKHQYVRRNQDVGLCSPDLPWIAMGVTKRIGVLRNRWQQAEKAWRMGPSPEYERDAREIYGLLRESWEQGVSEVLLNDVVERYRPSIETTKVRLLHDITEQDCRALEEGMSECSRWIRGHDAPPADGTPFPKPPDLKRCIDNLEAWVKAIRKRRG